MEQVVDGRLGVYRSRSESLSERSTGECCGEEGGLEGKYPSTSGGIFSLSSIRSARSSLSLSYSSCEISSSSTEGGPAIVVNSSISSSCCSTHVLKVLLTGNSRFLLLTPLR